MKLKAPILVQLSAVTAATLPPVALADTLQARPGDPAWMHAGADTLSWAHMRGGVIGLGVALSITAAGVILMQMGAALLYILALAPPPVMLFWLGKVRFDAWQRAKSAAAA
jgi:hypothetical protein